MVIFVLPKLKVYPVSCLTAHACIKFYREKIYATNASFKLLQPNQNTLQICISTDKVRFQMYSVRFKDSYQRGKSVV